ncbi:MAG: MFS transporter [Acidobacteria bacterium]|nr:MAG: MFS transporter [Acidobacteriota bacterium]
MSASGGRPVGPADRPGGGWRGVVRGNVLALGLVSLLNDVSSEMLYPLLPLFLAGLAAPGSAAIALGAMDGIADTVAALVKIWSGRASDRARRRKPLTVAGYALSALARPPLALAAAAWHVIVLRAVDRVGKGMRGAPRDALIAESVAPAVRARAYAFHRALDHLGALSGPVLAAVVLGGWLGADALWRHGAAADVVPLPVLRRLFGLAAIPALAAVLVALLAVRERPDARRGEARCDPPASGQGGRLPPRLRLVLAALTLFALGNSTDLFLLFDAQARFGLGAGHVLGLWVLLHVAKILPGLPGGHAADRLGPRRVILAGWAVYALAYAGLALSRGPVATVAWIAVYGLHYGLVEGAERALVASAAPAALRGRAFGWFHALTGLALLPASLLFGVLWAHVGREAAFLAGAALAAAAAALLVVAAPGRRAEQAAP